MNESVVAEEDSEAFSVSGVDFYSCVYRHIERANLVQKSLKTYFEFFGKKELYKFAFKCEEKVVKGVLFDEGETSKGVYVVRGGQIRIVKKQISNRDEHEVKEIEIEVIGVGGVLGVEDCFRRKQNVHTFKAETTQNQEALVCHVAIIEGEKIAEIARREYKRLWKILEEKIGKNMILSSHDKKEVSGLGELEDHLLSNNIRTFTQEQELEERVQDIQLSNAYLRAKEKGEFWIEQRPLSAIKLGSVVGRRQYRYPENSNQNFKEFYSTSN